MLGNLLRNPVAGLLFQTERVAEVKGRPVGFAGSIPATKPQHPSELWGIYLLKDAHGSGLGQRLIDATLGDETAALWVAADNGRAQAFYRRNGFEPTGEEEVAEDWEGILELRMIRKSIGSQVW